MPKRTPRKAARVAKEAPAKRAEPPLLSGGNPQIPKADGDAPVQAYIAAMPGWKRKLGQRLDALIVRSVPATLGLRKAVKWNSPFYGIEGPASQTSWFLGVHCFTKYLKIAFFRGASLRPPPPGVSTQKNVRYLDIREDDALDETQIASWIRQAAAMPGWVMDHRQASADTRASPMKKATTPMKQSTRGPKQGMAARSPAPSVAARTPQATDWRSRTLARVRTLIGQADPEAIEERKWKKPSNAMSGVPVWSHAGIICTGETYKAAVKLTFPKGAALNDPSGLFNSSLEGSTRRAIDLHEGDEIDENAFKALVRAAVALNTSARSPAPAPARSPRKPRKAQGTS